MHQELEITSARLLAQWATIREPNGSTINNITIIPLPPQLDLTGGIWYLVADGTITFRSL
ncbi:MAG: hypothetical protein WA364_29980 [Candidatus Nitrosopolaris sp.]